VGGRKRARESEGVKMTGLREGKGGQKKKVGERGGKGVEIAGIG
jgi:hypothetical protein